MNRDALASAACTLLLAAALTTGCDSTDTPWQESRLKHAGQEASAIFERRIEVGRRSRLHLETVNGTVSLRGVVGSTSILLRGRRRVFSKTKEDAKRHLTDLAIRIEALSDDILIGTDQPKHPEGRTYVVDYSISVPATLGVEIVSVNGRVDLVNLQGPVVVNVINGAAGGWSSDRPASRSNLSDGNVDTLAEMPGKTSVHLDGTFVKGAVRTTHLTFSNRFSSSMSLACTSGIDTSAVGLSGANGDFAFAEIQEATRSSPPELAGRTLPSSPRTGRR